MEKHLRIVIVLNFVVLMSLLLVFAEENNGNLNQEEAKALYESSLSVVTNSLSSDVSSDASFCIVDRETDWNKAFNYSSNLDFLSSCMAAQGDVSQRLCTAAEMKYYMDKFLKAALLGNSAVSLKPNNNCNRTSWVSGCEPGWACSAGPTLKVNLNDSTAIPPRTSNCLPCCEGFFCPGGLTCMIPCPLGSYCPLATLNQTTGLCEPYLYQLPPGETNHTCGGADVWANVGTSQGIFCPAGSYCPSTTQNITCSSGNYCRLGSTFQTRCSKLISCKSNAQNENIQSYGIMFISALTALLLIIYNFSDHILNVRERRRAKSREKAERSLRESQHARSRWKVAKDALKEHPDLLQATSRTTTQRSNSGSSHFSPMEPEGMSTVHVHEKTTKRKTPKEKENTKETQIFRYAYAQIEKERSREHEKEIPTFQRVVSMATNALPIRRRPLIEISFKDLTLELKGKQKYLLRCLNGKLIPGHITAVMGPSGAGKTSFLSVLAGKTIGCTTKGMILINGQPESIHSYKKITGFVPQDDIVHGNLTVEENLWFSARCRLPSDMRKEERVLILERVLDNLGLQEIRDSLVGTVEKRGISGGQRKRVNVGLEMVMEPSLLFLDEPTSGLDSASSLLLLRALKREAYEGVNICMVVHQPSYALFKMFDELVLLAKGGLMVYQGSVEKIEAYFSNLGINVPDRINPPDYYIDILEGIVEPSSSSSVTYKELPIMWMIQNGYPVPEDMRSTVVMLDTSSISNGSVHSNLIRHSPLKQRDLSNRRTPSVILQYKYYLGRISKQRLRDAKLEATDYLILLIAGACVGAISKIKDTDFGAFEYSYTLIAMALLCQIAALRSFADDKLQYWRESGSGMSNFAHFLAKDTIDYFNILLKPAIYLSMFYFFTNPMSTFLDNYIVLLCLVYCVTGMGYAFAILFDHGPSQLFSVLFPVCLTLVSSQALSNASLKFISNFCYPKWALEALVIANARRYSGVWLITRCVALQKYQYSIHSWPICVMVLILFGMASRAIAFIALLTVQRR